MSQTKIILFFLLLILLPSAISPLTECNSLECFNQKESPTASELLTISQKETINYDHFEKLNSEEQKKFLQVAEFTKPANQAIADKYFSGQTGNVNGNKEIFSKYWASQGVKITFLQGMITEYSQKGKLTGSYGESINLKEFQNSALKDKYTISIEQGRIILISNEKKLEFSGEIKDEGAGNLALEKGTIQGKEIKNGKSIKINKKGEIEITASEIGGIIFEGKGISIIKDTGIEILKGTIKRITKEEYIEGKCKVLDSAKGKLKFKKGTKLNINGIDITGTKDVELFLNQEPGLFDKGNQLVVSKEIKASGEGFQITLNPNYFLNQENADIFLPEKGVYKLGDKGITQKDYENIYKIQEIIGAEPNGIFGKNTKEALKIWQKKHNLFADGIFGKDSLNAYFKDLAKNPITLTPENGEIKIALKNTELDINIKGTASIKTNGETITTDGIDLSRKIGKTIQKANNIPILVTLRDENNEEIGSYQRDIQLEAKEKKEIKIGSQTYSLAIGEAYIVSAGQTAYTKAVAPKITTEELQNLPNDLKEKITKAGHVGIIYLDNDGTLRTTESIWAGVIDKPWEESHLYKIQNTINGIYEFTDTDSQKIIEQSKKDAKKSIGWFFTDINNPIATAGLNLVRNNDYTEFRCCTGHICSLSQAGGTNLVENSKYLPLQNSDEKKLEEYISKFGIKGEIIKDISISKVGSIILKAGISILNTVENIEDVIGINPPESAPTPSQIIYGNLKAGTIDILDPVNN